MTIQPGLISKRFENAQKKRYYQVMLAKDLFGDWVITKAWGSLHTANGRKLHVACSSYEEGLKLLEAIDQIRKRRGYKLCNVF